MDRIYLDNNATTALDPRVLSAMLKELQGPPSNPSSVHFFGRQARQALTEARISAADFFGSKQDEITFTSSGTESIHLMLSFLKNKGHLITTSIEHSALDRPIRNLYSQGLDVTFLPVGLWGAPLPEVIENEIRPDTAAIVLSASNSETGIYINIEKIANIAFKRGIPLLLDCVSFVGKEPIPLHPGITAMSISGHKIHGPKGSGILFHRSSLKLNPILLGGGQERQLRSGTENLSAILGIVEALNILKNEQSAITEKLQNLRMHFERSLMSICEDVVINGEGPRISNTSNLCFKGIDGETLLIQLDIAGIAASHGSACSSGSVEPSRVLTQMGIDRKSARSSLRFSFGRTNTTEEVERAVDILSRIIKKLRIPAKR